MEIDTDSADCAAPSHVTTSAGHETTSPLCLHLAPLVPATVCLRSLLLFRLSKQEATSSSLVATRLESLMAYLTRIPGFQLLELQPLLMWKKGVSFMNSLEFLASLVFFLSDCPLIHFASYRLTSSRL